MHVLFMHYNLESIDTIDGVYMQMLFNQYLDLKFSMLTYFPADGV